MKDPKFDLNEFESGQLASLWDEIHNSECPWSPNELAAIWRHQLDSRICEGLSNFESLMKDATTPLDGASLESFEDLLNHPSPPVSLLEATKTFAKACRNAPIPPLPLEIATALYFSSIVVARICHGQTISTLHNAHLVEGLEWTLSQPWLDQKTRTLIQTGLDLINGQCQ